MSNINDYRLNKYRLSERGYYIDPNTISLFHFNGTDGSYTFTDETGKGWYRYGNSQIDTAQSKFGGASALFDGTGDYIYTPDDSGFNFGSGDFTFETWVRFNAVGSLQFFISQRTGYGNNQSFTWYADGAVASFKIYFAYTTNGSTVVSQAFNTVLTTNTWYHIAIVRYGTTVKCYINGVAEANTLNIGSASIYNSTADIVIANARPDIIQGINGWLDEFRVSNVARWTADFTPPSDEY